VVPRIVAGMDRDIGGPGCVWPAGGGVKAKVLRLAAELGRDMNDPGRWVGHDGGPASRTSVVDARRMTRRAVLLDDCPQVMADRHAVRRTRTLCPRTKDHAYYSHS
jgi:hypothetical protein